MHGCLVIDVPQISRTRITWNNCRDGKKIIQEILDEALVNLTWT